MAPSFKLDLSVRQFFNRADKYSSIKYPQVSNSLTRSSRRIEASQTHLFMDVPSHLFVITSWNIHVQQERCNLKAKWEELFGTFQYFSLWRPFLCSLNPFIISPSPAGSCWCVLRWDRRWSWSWCPCTCRSGWSCRCDLSWRSQRPPAHSWTSAAHSSHWLITLW